MLRERWIGIGAWALPCRRIAYRDEAVSRAMAKPIAARSGAVAPGFLADLIALTADPLADVAALRSPDFVMKAGRIAKREGRMLPAEDWAAGSRHP